MLERRPIAQGGKAEKILILGGTSKEIVLYAKSKFEEG